MNSTREMVRIALTSRPSQPPKRLLPDRLHLNRVKRDRLVWTISALIVRVERQLEVPQRPVLPGCPPYLPCDYASRVLLWPLAVNRSRSLLEDLGDLYLGRGAGGG